MQNPQSETLTLPAREVSRGFAEAISQVRYCGRRVLVTKHGRAVAGIVSVADLQRLASESESPNSAPEARKARRPSPGAAASGASADRITSLGS